MFQELYLDCLLSCGAVLRTETTEEVAEDFIDRAHVTAGAVQKRLKATQQLVLLGLLLLQSAIKKKQEISHRLKHGNFGIS